MSKYIRNSSLYSNFGENRLDPILQQQEKIDEFNSPQYSAVIQVNPTQEDESWLEKVLFQQQISTNKNQNLNNENRKLKYDYLNRNQNLYDFSRKVQSQSLIRKNIVNPSRKQQQISQKQKYLSNRKLSVQNRCNQYFNAKNQSHNYYDNQEVKNDHRKEYGIRTKNILTMASTQNNGIDQDKLKKIQQKIKNYSYKSHYSTQKVKEKPQMFRKTDINYQYDSCIVPKVKQSKKNIENIKPSHRCTPTFNENELNNIQIMRRHLQTIFCQLTKQKQMSCYNSDLSKITQDVKYLLGPIFGELKIKKKLISKEQFILRALQLIKDYEFQQINQLLANCSYLNKNTKAKILSTQENQLSSKRTENYLSRKENYFNEQKDYLKDQKKYQQFSSQKLNLNRDRILLQINNNRKPLGQINTITHDRNISPNKLQNNRKGPSKSPYIKVSESNEPSFQIQKGQVISHIKDAYENNKIFAINSQNDETYKYEKDEDLSILQKLQSRFANHFSANRNLDNQHLQKLSFEELIRYS